MKYFDYLLDSPKKRYSFFTIVLVITLVYLATINFQLGYLLRLPKSLSEFQEVLNLLPLSKTFLGRLVLLEFSLKVNLLEIIKAIHFPEYLLIFTLFLIFVSEKDLFYQKIKQVVFLIVLVVILKYSMILGLILKTKTSVDVFLITNNLSLIGLILIISSLVVVIIALYLVYVIYDNLKITNK